MADAERAEHGPVGSSDCAHCAPAQQIPGAALLSAAAPPGSQCTHYSTETMSALPPVRCSSIVRGVPTILASVIHLEDGLSQYHKHQEASTLLGSHSYTLDNWRSTGPFLCRNHGCENEQCELRNAYALWNNTGPVTGIDDECSKQKIGMCRSPPGSGSCLDTLPAA